MTAPSWVPTRIIGAEWAGRGGDISASAEAAQLAAPRPPCPICGHPTYDCTPEYAAAAQAVSVAEQAAPPYPLRGPR